jgi:AraC family transcriptional regulator
MDLDRRPAVYAAGNDTCDDWQRAVLRSIGAMRDDLGYEHSLRSLARSAWLSPFHFHRIFQRVTDSTPARFLAAWRMAEAKRLLAQSETSVTDICMQIGYSSLGTFTSQFTRMVGVSPGRFRRLLATASGRSFQDVLAGLAIRLTPPVRPQVTVIVEGGPGEPALAAVGLFPSGIPQRTPDACAVIAVPGSGILGDLPDGEYHPLAMCFANAVTVAEAVATAEPERCFVAAYGRPVEVFGGRAEPATVRLRLRPRRETDPPLVLAMPLLAAAEPAAEPVA